MLYFSSKTPSGVVLVKGFLVFMTMPRLVKQGFADVTVRDSDAGVTHLLAKDPTLPAL